MRRQFDSNQYGRQGQRQMLDILDGRPEEAVKDCEQKLASEPNDLESMFNLTVARCALKDYKGAAELKYQSCRRVQAESARRVDAPVSCLENENP